MVERIYITLKEASEHLRVRGLTEHSAITLRQAISDGTLAAVKDGRSWKTTIIATEAYVAALWRRGNGRSQSSEIARLPPKWGRKPKRPQTSEAIETPKKRGGPLKSRPRPARPESKRKREPKTYPEYEALPPEEKRRRFRDYLDGKRETWR